jgi:PAS domain S-box-containing protein
VRTNLSTVELWEISYIATKILSDSQDAHQAAARILHLLGSRFEAVFAAFWVLDANLPALRCAAVWPDSESPSAFATVTKQRHFGIGEGLPGKAWETRDVVWVPDVRLSTNFPRASVAKLVGIKTGFAFPATKDKSILAVIEILADEVYEPNSGLLDYFRALGGQIGLFLEHFNMTVSLSSAEQEFRLIADASPDAVITIDETSTVIFANPAIRDLLGYAPDELIGQSLTMIMPESLRPKHHAGIQRYNETGERRLDWNKIILPGLHKDGSQLQLQVAFGQFWRGGKRVFTGFLRQI